MPAFGRIRGLLLLIAVAATCAPLTDVHAAPYQPAAIRLIARAYASIPQRIKSEAPEIIPDAEIASESQPSEQQIEYERQLKEVDEVFDLCFLGTDSHDPDEILSRLNLLLRTKIEIIDRACGLTHTQSHKLELAGRGDIKRALGRIEKLRGMFRNAGAKPAMMELLQETELLQDLLEGGLFSGGSLFAKCMKHILTTEQIQRNAVPSASQTPR